MYPYTETCPGPSQATKINLFVSIVGVFKLTLLAIFVKSTIGCLNSSDYTADLFYHMQLIKCFPIPI